MLNDPSLVKRESLPIPETPLIGREQEVSALSGLLLRPEVRLVTLTGIGGVGKTRLGLEVASCLTQQFTDGVSFVPLGSVHDPNLVVPLLLEALGLQEADGWSLEERLRTSVPDKHLLLVLDNCEQVVPVAGSLSMLVRACPRVKVLITSRVVLSLPGEYEFPVLPLPLPDEAHWESLETLAHSPAIMLFLQRARRVRHDFALTTENARTLAEICIHLDGLPLALELAATRVKLLPPRTLLARLSHRFEILTSVSSEFPPHQRTLRTILDWSYQLLTPQEQQLFQRLCVFAGPFTLEAAEALCTDEVHQNLTVLDGLASLLDKSLLYQVERGAGEARFVMLETVREYGLQRLDASGETRATKLAHSLYYLTLAEQAQFTGKEQRIWLHQLEQASANLREALTWMDEQGEDRLMLRLSWALWRFWWMRGQIREGCIWLKQALAKATEESRVPLLLRARVLSALGTLIGIQGDLEQAEHLCQESQTLARQQRDNEATITALWMLGYVAREKSLYTSAWNLAQESLGLARSIEHVPGIMYSLETLAAVALDQSRYQEARTLIEESLFLSRRVGDLWESARSLWLLAVTQLFQGEIAQAGIRFEESLSISRDLHDARGSAYCLVMSGYVAYFQGKPETMDAFMQEARTSYRRAGDRRGMAEALHGLGWARLAQGDAPAAQILFEESLMLLRRLDRKWFVALALDGLAASVAMQEQAVWAIQLWGAAHALREAIEARLSPFIETVYQPFLAKAQASLSKEAFAIAWETGRSEIRQMEPTEALFSPPEPGMVDPSAFVPPFSQEMPPPNPAGLTAREGEVLRWVTQGLTDIQIGEKLVISPRTVGSHLSSIYNKLGVSSRAAATRLAVETHLV